MKLFFGALYGVSAILFLGFMAWIVTRMMHLEQANYWVGRVIVWDLYAIGVVVSYVAFVGGFHLWEKLTGRMEPDEGDPPREA